MAFASIHIPDFWVQAVTRTHARLRESAIALVDGVPPLVKVVAASAVALNAGIQVGMSKSQAEQFSGIEIHSRSRTRERAAHAALLDLGWSISPRIEDHAPHEIVVDLSGLEALFGSHKTTAGEVAGRASALGLVAQIAVSANLDVAIHAARGFAGITVIGPGEEAKRLGALPVEVLSPFEFFAQWQYALVIDEHAQKAFAAELGFCPLHLWQLGAVSSPLGASVGWAKLAERLSQAVTQAATSPSASQDVPALVRRSTDCRICRLLREAEKKYVHWFQSLRLIFRRRRTPQASRPVAESALDCSIGEHAILGKPIVLLSTGHSHLCLFSSDRGNRRQAQSPGRTRDSRNPEQ